MGGYEVVELLEESSDGVTYKVRNLLAERVETLRVLPKFFLDDQERVNRFLREAKVHSRISHPNIATFYHAAEIDGQLVMATEYVEGTTLAQRRELGPLPVAEGIDYVSQVLSALSYAHALGIVHREVTPANIILTSDGKVKLTGFRLAKSTTDAQLTQPGRVIGSLNYLSPEQIRGRTDCDGRTDIYSVGVVLYEVVTGRRPFHRKSQFEVMLAHATELPPAPSVVNPKVPAELTEVILTAMAKDPSARIQTADEFRQRLDVIRGVRPAKENSGRRQAQPQRFAGLKLVFSMVSWRLVAFGWLSIMAAVLAFFVIFRHF